MVISSKRSFHFQFSATTLSFSWKPKAPKPFRIPKMPQPFKHCQKKPSLHNFWRFQYSILFPQKVVLYWTAQLPLPSVGDVIIFAKTVSKICLMFSFFRAEHSTESNAETCWNITSYGITALSASVPTKKEDFLHFSVQSIFDILKRNAICNRKE
jgi:hypothetical protein